MRRMRMHPQVHVDATVPLALQAAALEQGDLP